MLEFLFVPVPSVELRLPITVAVVAAMIEVRVTVLAAQCDASETGKVSAKFLFSSIC